MRWVVLWALLLLLVAGCGDDSGNNSEVNSNSELDQYIAELEQRVVEQQQMIANLRRERAELLMGDAEPEYLMIEPEPYDQLPDEVRAWVDQFTQTKIGAHRQFGNRVYVVASLYDAGNTSLNASISRAYSRDGMVEFQVNPFSGWSDTHFAVASLAASDWPEPEFADFVLDGIIIPFANSLGLDEITLPYGERIAVSSPLPGDVVTSPMQVEGFATLFEGYASMQLLDGDGQELAVGGASCGSLSWDSFSTELEFNAPVGTEVLLVISETAAEDELYQVEIRLVVGE